MGHCKPRQIGKGVFLHTYHKLDSSFPNYFGIIWCTIRYLYVILKATFNVSDKNDEDL